MKRKLAWWAIFALAAAAPAFGAKTQSFQGKTLSVSAGGQLEFKASQGDVDIRLWDRNEVTVAARGIDSDELQISQTGNLVRLDYRGSGHNTRFELQVPVRFNITVSTGGGDLRISGNLEGNLDVSTLGGDINFDDILGEATIKSSGGDITGGDVAGNSDIRTLGGDIVLGSVRGAVEASTHGGDVRIREVGSTLKAKSFGGDVEVGDIGGEASLNTLGGDVNVGRVSGKAELKTAGGDIELKGATGDVVASTAGGDIDLREVSGFVDAKTAGGDINAELMAAAAGGSSLVSKGGDIRLGLGPNVRATIEARIRIRGSWNHKRSDYKFYSDFPQASYKEDQAEGDLTATYQINGGGAVINLETVNGSIRIEKIGSR